MERSEKRQIVEALLLAAREPLPAARIAAVIPRATPKLVSELMAKGTTSKSSRNIDGDHGSQCEGDD